MKILIFSDVHANMDALNILYEEFSVCDLSICLGDIVGYYCQVNEVSEFLQKKKTICLLGNHDNYVLNGITRNVNERVLQGIAYARAHLTEKNLNCLSTLDSSCQMSIDGRLFFCCHGSPWDPLEEYLYADNPHLANLVSLPYDAIFWGHTHRPYCREEHGKLFANPGSVGQPRHAKNKVCALLFDSKNFTLHFIEKEIVCFP